MIQSIIVLGDDTSDGGRVISTAHCCDTPAACTEAGGIVGIQRRGYVALTDGYV